MEARSTAGGADGPARDMVGYGNPATRAVVAWPHGARVALSLVVNYEEGGEYTLLNGDEHAETFLGEISGGVPVRHARNLNMESVFEYGSRVGFWRIMALLDEHQHPCTVFAVGRALELNPAVCAFLCAHPRHEVVSHGYRWIDYADVDEQTEREHMRRAVRVHQRVFGAAKPLAGVYVGRGTTHTRRVAVEEVPGLVYDCDSYADDVPYWVKVQVNDGSVRDHLVIPHTLDANDLKFAVAPGFSAGSDFLEHLKDTLDTLLREGGKMMTIGLHGRLIGRPGRIAALRRFLEHVHSLGDAVWVCTRSDIARHWRAAHPPPTA